MIIAVTCLIAIAVIAFILGIRPKDLRAPEPESPFAHLDERKAAIYENLRDLQFEYRLDKLSDEDYQATKKDLQRELAGVLAEIDKLKNLLAAGAVASGARASAPAGTKPNGAKPSPKAFTCPTCGATFPQPLKFCGECGKPMEVSK